MSVAFTKPVRLYPFMDQIQAMHDQFERDDPQRLSGRSCERPLRRVSGVELRNTLLQFLISNDLPPALVSTDDTGTGNGQWVADFVGHFMPAYNVYNENQLALLRLDRAKVAAYKRKQRCEANQTGGPPATRDPRLSMPVVDSDDSGSEPDLSTLGMNHQGRPAMPPAFFTQDTDNDEMDQEPLEEPHDMESDMEAEMEPQDTSLESELDNDEEDGEAEEPVPLVDPATMGLKEISNLAKFTVSSHKPGNGVEELRSDDLNAYWQSDGPQPHKLTVYFVKRVGIRDLRFYVNYNDDESYTPTKIVFKSGTSENNLIEFASMTLESPVGWQQVPLNNAGGDPDGQTLVSYVLQMQILENHQNGKDTHLRGIKIYAFDPESGQGPGREKNPLEDLVVLMDDAAAAAQRRNGETGAGEMSGGDVRLSGLTQRLAEVSVDADGAGFTIPDFMKEPEIR